MNTPFIETERLILRKFNETDIKAIYDIYSDLEMNKFLPWFPLKNIEEAKIVFKEKYERKYVLPKGYDYGLCLKKDNRPIGYINVDMGEAHDLGYGLRKEFWNKGIITEMT